MSALNTRDPKVLAFDPSAPFAGEAGKVQKCLPQLLLFSNLLFLKGTA